MDLLKRIFGKPEPIAADKVTPERPADWNFTLDDLFQEIKAGKRKTIEPHEGAWAKEYERSLIPDKTRFPLRGDVYESEHNQTIDFMTAWSKPFTGDGVATLLEGERVWVHTDSNLNLRLF